MIGGTRLNWNGPKSNIIDPRTYGLTNWDFGNENPNASVITTVEINALPLDGGNASAWAPLFGTSIGAANSNLTNSSGTYYPVYRASSSVFNGLPCLDFSTSNSMVASGVTIATTAAVIMSGALKTLGAPIVNDFLFDDVAGLNFSRVKSSGAGNDWFIGNGDAWEDHLYNSVPDTTPFVWATKIRASGGTLHLNWQGNSGARVENFGGFSNGSRTNAACNGIRVNGRGNGATNGAGGGRNVAMYVTGITIINADISVTDIVGVMAYHRTYRQGIAI